MVYSQILIHPNTKSLTLLWLYSKLYAAWSRGVVAKHAALSRPRSRVRIPSGPLIAQLLLGDFGFKLQPVGAGVIIGH
jgi:hypothetical protein